MSSTVDEEEFTEETTTAEILRNRKLQRMRLGQSAYEIVSVPSDEEVRLAIVPITEADYAQALEIAEKLSASDNVAGLQRRDRTLNLEILIRAIREPNNIEEKVFSSAAQMSNILEPVDVDHCLEKYWEMTEKSSPSLEGIPPEEFEALKKALQEINWNELSGRSWYLAKRFLGAISPLLLKANLHGSSLTTPLTTTKD